MDIDEPKEKVCDAGFYAGLCTCFICVMVVATLMVVVMVLHDKEEAQGYDYPMYQEDFLPEYHKKGRCRSDGPGCSKEDLIRLGYEVGCDDFRKHFLNFLGNCSMIPLTDR